MGDKIDTRALGLDAGLAFIRWLTGAENLHYGLWTGLEPNAGNLGAAQAAYTDLLFSYLPPGRLRILDIGGGAGETARKLTDLGHEVHIVIPSNLLADRCRVNAPDAVVHEARFEEFDPPGMFDLCLFSESFQYVPLKQGLSRALDCLADDGSILIADCFRSAEWSGPGAEAVVGGGHPWAAFQKEMDRLPLMVQEERDITTEVAPSIDLEQGLFNVIGHVVGRVDHELSAKRPVLRWSLVRTLGLMMNRRRRDRLAVRLFERGRNSETFCRYNHYRILKLSRA